MLWRKATFVLLAVLCLSPYCYPPAALLLGIAVAITIGRPFARVDGRFTKRLFEVSVVLLGFGTDLKAVFGVIREGFVFILIGSAVMVALAYLLGRWTGEESRSGDDEFVPGLNGRTAVESASALPAVMFVFSTAALVAYPFAAYLLHLSAKHAALWPSMTVFLAPMAIGAALTQGPEVLSLAVPLVLSRVLLVYAAGLAVPKGAGPESRMTGFPWLVPLFLLVVAARTYAPLVIFPSVFEAVVNLAKAGIILSLFFLGTILSRDVFGVLRSRAAIAALIAWTLFSFLSLAAILRLV